MNKSFAALVKGRILFMPLLFIFFIFCAGGNVMSFGSRESGTKKETITVTGRVRLVGTALFSNVVVTDEEDQDWYVENEDREKLARLEQQQVTVTGETEYQDIILANGEKVGVRRFLRNIKVK
jgi:hypothetical protein